MKGDQLEELEREVNGACWMVREIVVDLKDQELLIPYVLCA